MEDVLYLGDQKERSTMKHRLSRRYDPVVRTLKLLMETGNARVKESAAMRLSEVYLLHDPAGERKETAIARAEARAAEAAAVLAGVGIPQTDEALKQPSSAISDTSQSVKSALDEYLQRTIVAK